VSNATKTQLMGLSGRRQLPTMTISDYSVDDGDRINFQKHGELFQVHDNPMESYRMSTLGARIP
jgi:hypothetical protein